MGRSWFWLYRPTVPSVRAQSVQVVHMAHAMARRGHEAHLAAEPVRPGITVAEALAFYDLEPHPSLHITLLSGGRTAASLAFRAVFARWVARTRGQGIVYARSKRYTRQALRWLGGRFTLVLEAHEVDSVQAAERTPQGANAFSKEHPANLRALEAAVLRRADGVVANAPGTLELLGSVHRLPPAVALHNGTHASRVRHPVGPGEGIGYVGSVRESKDLRTLARAAALLSRRVHLVGPVAGEATEALQELAGGRLVLEGPLPHRDVPDRLARFRVLVLPLAHGLFGELLTSPLKLWDYQAAGVPIVGADLPSLHLAAPGAFAPYVPEDPADLARVLERVATDEAVRARLLDAAVVRTWDDRAAEVEAFVESL